MYIKTPFGRKQIINADITASGVISNKIEDIMKKNVYPYYSNTHSNAYCGKLMAHYIEDAKDVIRSSVGAKKSDSIIFTGNGCSGAVTHLIHCLGLRHETSPKTVVFISVAEHHSNYLPWTHLPVEIVIVPLTTKGVINLSFLKKKT